MPFFSETPELTCTNMPTYADVCVCARAHIAHSIAMNSTHFRHQCTFPCLEMPPPTFPFIFLAIKKLIKFIWPDGDITSTLSLLWSFWSCSSLLWIVQVQVVFVWISQYQVKCSGYERVSRGKVSYMGKLLVMLCLDLPVNMLKKYVDRLYSPSLVSKSSTFSHPSYFAGPHSMF
jgi:hypothetical protein